MILGRIPMVCNKKTLLFVLILLIPAALIFAGGAKEKLPPSINLDKQDEYISPASAPGIKDDVTIKISVEADKGNKMVIKEYRLTIADAAGNTVREWANKDETTPGFFSRMFIAMGFMAKPALEVPESITWDGKNAAGAFVPDGAYTYVLEAWDDGGVSAKSEPRKIIVDNTPPSAEVRFDYRIFSPNGDGRRDVLPIALKGTKEDLWTAVAKNSAGTQVAKGEFPGDLPSEFYWTGADEKGVKLPDGEYVFTLSATDKAGNSFSVTTEPVVIDTKSRAFSVGTDFRAFSPNGDGVQDRLTITPANFSVDGLLDATIEAVDQAGRVRFSLRTQPPIPTSIVFDGRGDDGKLLPDGVYRARATARYANGMVETAESEPVVIDTVPPTARLRASTPIFSPNNDRSKDSVTLYFDVSKPALWKGTVLDGRGNIAAVYELEGKPPAEVFFDGIGFEGEVIPDDTYTAFIEGRDAAGNRAESNRLQITVDTRPTTLAVGTDLEAFSPNRDGVKDLVSIIPVLHVGRETEAYKLVIVNDRGAPVRTLEAKSRVPAALPWDGKDDKGSAAPDGVYTAELQVTYINGNMPKAATKPFVLDTVFPKGEFYADRTVLRIGPEGKVEPISVTQRTSEGDLWTGELISAAGGRVAARLTWEGSSSSHVWDGRTVDGTMLPDGLYIGRISSEDRAGNRTVYEFKDIAVETTRPDLSVTPALAAFAPTGNGIMDTISFDLNATDGGLSSWILEFEHESRGVVGSVSDGNLRFPRTAVWDGRDKSGGRAPDGLYHAQLTVAYNGRKSTVRSASPFRLDTMAPAVKLDVKPKPFSPDHDGKDDILDIMLSAVDESRIDSWTLKVLNTDGRDFIGFSGRGNPPPVIAWDGYSAAGDLVRSAKDYPLRFSVRDSVGNEAQGGIQIAVDVLVFREGLKDKIRVANIQFAPWTTEYLEWNPEIGKTNVATIDEVAAMMKRYPDYKVRLEGHAVSVLWEDKPASEREHRYVLIPLSQGRAETIKKALVEKGVEAARVEIKGHGGDFPLVPFSDLEKRWVNRRVEFILLRE
jgi:flagellar hook assembly protein FlgD